MASLLSQIERVPVESLEFYPGNARRGNVEAIAASLKENEQYAPIVVQRSTRHVLSGNHTLKAAISLGWAEIDAVILDVDDRRAQKINISANRIQDLGDYDDRLLAELLASLDGDLEGTGFDPQDLDKLADSLGDPEPPEDFKGYDDDIDTEYCCPKCGYSWSGKPK